MSYAIGSLVKGGGLDTHYQLLEVIKTTAEAEGWETLRYDTVSAEREWIGKSTGYSGTEEVFIGFKCYQSVPADYYNIAGSTFVGYVPANTFWLQPGAKYGGIPTHNNAITYFITCSPQMLAMGLRVGTPVYTHGYFGKMFPYARPSEYPSPLVSAGILDGAGGVRFSDSLIQMPYKGVGYNSTYNNIFLRHPDGNYRKPWCYPFSNRNNITSAASQGPLFSDTGPTMAPAGANYQLEPIILNEVPAGGMGSNNPANIFGELERVFAISGFNNGPENVVQMGGSSVIDQTGLSVADAVEDILGVGGRAFVVLQDIYRTTWSSFIALEMVA